LLSGFFRSIALSRGNSLQDTLRLMTLWFKYGYHEAVNLAVTNGATTVSIDVWLEVIPQIIARIHINNSLVRNAIEQLLNGVGRAHPQALIYPLLVASKSPVQLRREVAHAIMNRMKDHSPELVEQVRSDCRSAPLRSLC
jgi:FKBP12-rapamycin complex-associated protein